MRPWLLLCIAFITAVNTEHCVNSVCTTPRARQLFRDCNFDGICDPDEDPYGCSDCDGRAIVGICGNGVCEEDEEIKCPDDCKQTPVEPSPICGDLVCDAGEDVSAKEAVAPTCSNDDAIDQLFAVFS